MEYRKIATNQTKTMLLLMLVFTVIILLFSGLVYFSIVSFSHQRFNELLKIRVSTVIQIEKNKEELSLSPDRAADSRDEELPLEKDYVLPIPADHSFAGISKTINVPETFLNTILKKGEASYKGKDLYYIGRSFTSKDQDYIAIVSAKNHYLVYYLAYLQRALVTCMILSIFFSLIFSFYLSKTLFSPILNITDKVKQISSENLHLRLESQPGNKELNALVDTFNDMLNRIETSFETQNHLIGNVSHELRTPLTSIMGEADVALTHDRSGSEYRETLQIILNEAEKLDRKIKALLMIAQTGFDGKIQKMEKVRIDQLLWDVIETLRRINTKNSIHMDLSMLPDNPRKLKVLGNEQLLHLALANIISNACKYSDFRQVKVSLGSTDSHIYVIVKDEGIGIPAEEMDKIYDPFFRASNTVNYEGYGIGLPLARNIVKIHHGDLLVSSQLSHGTTVQMRFPILTGIA